MDSYNGTENATSDGIKFDLTESTVYARYVRVVGTYNSKNNAFHLNELKVYGDLADDEVVNEYLIQLKKQELEDLIDEYDSTYVEEEYTEETWKTFSESIDKGKSIIEEEDATLEDIKSIKEEILKNVENLKYRPDTTKKEGYFRLASFNLAAYNHPDTEKIVSDELPTVPILHNHMR